MNNRRADYEMQPSFLSESNPHGVTKMSTTETPRSPPPPPPHMRQLQEQRHLYSVLNDSCLSMSPNMTFPADSLLDLGGSNFFSAFGGGGGISGNFSFGPTPTDDDAVVGSPPAFPPELMLANEALIGFYMDRCVTPDPCSWNRGFEELDRELDLEDGILSGGDKMGGQRNQQGDPTLAALNSAGDDRSVLDDLDLDDLPLPDEIECRGIRVSGLNTPTNDSQDGLMISLSTLVGGGGHPARHDVSGGRHDAPELAGTTLHEMLVRSRAAAAAATATVTSAVVRPSGSGDDWRVAGSVKPESKLKVAAASPLPPVSTSDGFGVGDLPRRTIRPRTATMSSVGSALDGSLLGSSILSSETSQDIKYEGNDDSHDEGFDSDLDDSDRFSDAESTSSWEQNHRSRSPNNTSSSTATRPRRKERFFWQYNLQAKGPKGNRMPLATDQVDPHMLDEVTDPVFSPNCQVKGIKHTGKARRGDGNDLTPNPCKLHQIGEELKKLSKVIDDLTPVGELPFSVRPKSRKEKNKLASRACRLKKKAQHEANKIKLYGLEQEHRRLMFTLTKTKAMLRHHIEIVDKNEVVVKRETKESLENQLDAFATQAIKSTRVAGNTIDFVNKVLAKVSSNGRSVHELEQE